MLENQGDEPYFRTLDQKLKFDENLAEPIKD